MRSDSVCSKTIKATGGNTKNLLSRLKTTHSNKNKYFEAKRLAEEKRRKNHQNKVVRHLSRTLLRLL